MLVPLTGLGPVQYRYRGILSPLCLPFHHSGIPLSILSYEMGRVKEKATASERVEKTYVCVNGGRWKGINARDTPKMNRQKGKMGEMGA